MKTPNWEKTLESLFENIGLTEKEAKVYRVILDLGTAKAVEIIEKSGFKRGITYLVLYNLEKDGLITSFKKEKKTYFRVKSPQRLVELLEKHERKIKQVKGGLGAVMPKLISQYKLSIGKPTIRYFEGEEGIHEVFEDIYAPKKDVVLGCVDLEITDKAFPSHVIEKLIPKRIKNQVKAFSFVADSPKAKEVAKKDKLHLRKTILLDKKKYPLPAEIDVYEDKIAMLSFTKGEFIGLLIENRDFAQSLRSIFKLAFSRTGKSLANQNTRSKSNRS